MTSSLTQTSNNDYTVLLVDSCPRKFDEERHSHQGRSLPMTTTDHRITGHKPLYLKSITVTCDNNSSSRRMLQVARVARTLFDESFCYLEHFIQRAGKADLFTVHFLNSIRYNIWINISTLLYRRGTGVIKNFSVREGTAVINR